MIRLLLDPPLFAECETAEEAATLVKLMGLGPVTVATERPRLVIPVVPPIAPPVRHPKGRMEPTGKTKPCKKCGKAFPVLDRSDCPSVYCRDCRPTQLPRKNPKPPIPVAGRLVARKHAEPVSCRSCGASVPEFESINGECLQCAPIAARKRSA